LNPLALRWLKFNFVGGIGIAVQLGMYAILFRLFHVRNLIASGLAVEAAVLHNFVWHERYTWKEETRGFSTPSAVATRLLRFHAGNGLIWILGNIALMHIFVDMAHWNPYLSNILAIAICSLLNFAASEYFVFRK